MAGVTHLAVGLATKKVAPKMHAGILILAAYVIDIIWGGFWLAGVEKMPGAGVDSAAPWSHGLFMAVVWSVLSMVIAKLVSRDNRTSAIIGALVFSHWVVDFIAKPMTHAFPSDAGLPLLFAGSPTVGLGLWGTAMGEYIGEYGSLLVGIAIYAVTVIGIKKDKKLTIAK